LKTKNEFSQCVSASSYLNPFTFKINDRLSVRLYQDCRPTCLETAPLQKGLVLLLDGKELIEEGVGFGVPVAKYKDKTYFPGSAKSWIETFEDHCTLVKSFVLDTISRKRLGRTSYVNETLYHFLHRAFELGYFTFPRFAQVAYGIMEIRKALKVETDFIKPRGTATIKYICKPDEIQVAGELSLIELDRCKEILILNEQGATFFRRYSDSAGLVLFDHKIGAWSRIMADEASFSDLKQNLTFTARNKPSASFFRGWEKTKDRFSWSGLTYSLLPGIATFQYSLGLNVRK
jgi:hypothetical protein